MFRVPACRAAPSLVRQLSTQPATNTISPTEIAHFSALAAHWWDPTGEFALLHRMNPARIHFVRDSILRQEELEGVNPARWLEGKSVLDVGCGGGIFAEVRSSLSVCMGDGRSSQGCVQALSRLGAKTVAIDASPVNISVAQTHAALDPAFSVPSSPFNSPSITETSRIAQRNSLEYRHCAAEDLVKEGKQFDVVCAMEVIEHVEDPKGFLNCLGDLIKVRPSTLLPASPINGDILLRAAWRPPPPLDHLPHSPRPLPHHHHG